MEASSPPGSGNWQVANVLMSREQRVPLFLQPLLSASVLALGTRAVAAGMIYVLGLLMAAYGGATPQEAVA
jgi:hypothetical protein